MDEVVFESMGKFFDCEEYLCEKCQTANVCVFTKTVETRGSMTPDHADLRQTQEIEAVRQEIRLAKTCCNCGQVNGVASSFFSRLFSKRHPDRELNMEKTRFGAGRAEYGPHEIGVYLRSLLEKR